MGVYRHYRYLFGSLTAFWLFGLVAFGPFGRLEPSAVALEYK